VTGIFFGSKHEIYLTPFLDAFQLNFNLTPSVIDEGDGFMELSIDIDLEKDSPTFAPFYKRDRSYSFEFTRNRALPPFYDAALF